ncbi:MAG: hypothetical protein SCARUB_01979 [Candidatus Scalindua rubra]|uniref:DUF2442 domain-containing protein n=1 Tax=Candidatus Scalindua rubra TaxID=1872076 RepID=A0A1E3XBA0_9BACT|nr:MAG: hypothetical protein SCARUB_01979 [Candidatus Scalindua rubra]
MILHVIKAKYIEDYKVEVFFNDGRKGIADLSDALRGPIFKPLKDKNMFSQFKVDELLETIVWPNGADLAPEYIYYQAFKNEKELEEQFKEWGYMSHQKMNLTR